VSKEKGGNSRSKGGGRKYLRWDRKRRSSSVNVQKDRKCWKRDKTRAVGRGFHRARGVEKREKKLKRGKREERGTRD